MTMFRVVRRHHLASKKNHVILHKISGVGKEVWRRVIAEVSENETPAMIDAITKTLKLTGNIVDAD